MTHLQAFTIDASQLPLGGVINLLGRTGRVATNDRGLLDVLHSLCAGASIDPVAFRLQVFVHSHASPSGELPYFRGLHHLVFATFGSTNLFVFDILGRNIMATIAKELAHDRNFWQERLLPIAAGVLGASIGVLPLHAACLSFEGRGLLVAGASGTGKSTLSLALAKNGIDFVSDDWTYITSDHGELRAHGLSAPIKLLPDATEYFPELGQHDLRISLNGEIAYELPPGGSLRLCVETTCTPDCLVFYERVAAGEPELIRLSGEEARNYMQSSMEPLPPQLSLFADQRERIAAHIADLPCWRFRHSGSPQLAAQSLHTFFVPQEVRMSA